MTILYSPDTCSCVVLIEHGSLNYVDWVQKCPGHADKERQALVDSIFLHNKSFQISIEDQIIKAERKGNIITKRAEMNRIIALGPTIKNKLYDKNTFIF